jgi:hypothetical protein
MGAGNQGWGVGSGGGWQGGAVGEVGAAWFWAAGLTLAAADAEIWGGWRVVVWAWGKGR